MVNYNEQNVSEEPYSDTGNYENDLNYNEDDFVNNHQNIREDHQFEYLNFQKNIIDNSIIDHLIKWLSFESSVEIPLPNDYKYIKSALMKELMER